MTTHIIVDGSHYDIPEEVAKRMGEYYQTYELATREYNKLLGKVARLRESQCKYFKTRNSTDLKVSKAAEKDLDEYLAGKQEKAGKVQAELFG